MPATAGDALVASADALVASADADKAPKVSDPDGMGLAESVGFQVEGTDPDRPPRPLASPTEIYDPDDLEHLARTVGFQVEVTDSDHLLRPLAPVGATPTKISDPDGLEHLDGTVGFQIKATKYNCLTSLLASADANFPNFPDLGGLEQMVEMLALHEETTTESDQLVTASNSKSTLTTCEGQYGANSSPGITLTFPDIISFRSNLGFPDTSRATIVYMEGKDCYILNFRTMEALKHLFIPDLVNPFAPLHSTIVQAPTTWPLRRLVRYDECTWYSQSRRDWPSLSLPVLHNVLSDLDCTRDNHAFAYTCKSWWLASSLYPRPLLLDPLATSTWLFVTPVGRWNSAIGNFRLFPAPRIEQSTLIGGSGKFLIFLDNCCCCIINIHTGHRKEFHAPFCDVQRGVISAPPGSENSKILLVTNTSIVCKSVNSTDQWTVKDFGDIHVGEVDDLVFVGEIAYLINKRSRLFIITPALEISFLALGDFGGETPRTPDSGFGRRLTRSDPPKLVRRKNWLLEHHGELLRIVLMSFSLPMENELHSRFFMARIGADPMYKFFKDKSEKAGLPFPSNKWHSKAWIKMETTDLAEASVFLNSLNSVASFVSERPGRWGLKSGQVFTCRPGVFPWVSFDFGWVKEEDVIPENIGWPCPIFMDTQFLFAPGEELDCQTLFDKAPELLP